MSNCLLNVVAHHLRRFYYAVAEFIKDSRYVGPSLVFIVLAGQHKIVGSWSKGMTTLS